tara:strand:- start:626 stop:1396 length:771 start_codon:yes stop_codon:yes gene_type:complete
MSLLTLVRDSVLEVRKKLRETYCVDSGANSGDCRGKERILKYTSKTGVPWEKIEPLIAKAIDTKVVIVPPAELSSKWGVHDMGFFSRKDPPQISIVVNIVKAYNKRYGTYSGVKKFIKYTLYHEFGHAIDHALNIAWDTASSTGGYAKDVAKVVSGGRGREAYFDIGTEYGRRELFAEWSALQDLLGVFDEKDIKALCYIKRKYPNRGRIKWLASKGYEIKEVDYAVQSKLIQSFLNCDDHKDTLERLNSMGIKTK